MPHDIEVWKVRKDPKTGALAWKNYLYTSRENKKKGSGGTDWKPLATRWPGIDAKKLKPTKNDWMIVNVADKDPKKHKAHFIRESMLGDTGTLYRYDGEYWKRVIRRTQLVRDDDRVAATQTPGAGAATGAQHGSSGATAVADKDKAIYHRPRHLGWVQGDTGDLLVTTRSATTKKQAQALMRGQDAFAFTFIEGTRAEPGEIVGEMWKVSLEGKISEEQIDDVLKQQAQREGFEKLCQGVLQYFADNPNGLQQSDKEMTVGDLLTRLCVESTPGPTAGYAFPAGTASLVQAMAGIKDLRAPFVQAGQEALGVGVKMVVDIWSLHRLHMATGTLTSPQARGLWHDIATNIGKAPPAITSVIDVFHKIANAGQQWANIALTANTIMPLIGAVVGLEEAGRNFRKSDRAFQRLIKIKREIGRLQDDTTQPVNSTDDAIEENSELGRLSQYAIGKLGRRTDRLAVTSMAGLFGAAGSAALGIGAAVAVANAWNPLGWTLITVGAVGALGVTGYVVIRKLTKKSRHEHRATHQRPATAEEFAERLLDVYSQGDQGEKGHAEKAGLMLGHFGIAVKNGRLRGGVSRADAIATIVRHLTN